MSGFLGFLHDISRVLFANELAMNHLFMRHGVISGVGSGIMDT